jgi:hypothetical protein
VTTTAAAPAVSAAATAATASTTATATAASASPALGERHIRRAKCNPQRADTGGKSQDDKPGGELFADRIHDFAFPWKNVSSGPPPTRLRCARSEPPQL